MEIEKPTKFETIQKIISDNNPDLIDFLTQNSIDFKIKDIISLKKRK